MTTDSWKSYTDFKKNSTLAEQYYDLVRTAFETGVAGACGGRRVGRCLDLGCGSGELTRRLRGFADHVTGVDSSPGLIERATADPDRADLDFVLADVLDESIIGTLPEGGFDLITAAWLHNHLGTEAAQRGLLASVLRLLAPGGRIAFLFPGLGFTTRRAQRFFTQLDWHQQWAEETDQYAHGFYRFADSPRQELWAWRPMWLAGLHDPHFSLSFVDVKSLAATHGGLGAPAIEPPFEVMTGRRRAPRH